MFARLQERARQMQIGEAVRRFRRAQDMTQAKFARALGLSGSLISHIELGYGSMTFEQIARLKDVFPELHREVAAIKLAEVRQQLGLQPDEGEPSTEQLRAALEAVKRAVGGLDE